MYYTLSSNIQYRHIEYIANAPARQQILLDSAFPNLEWFSGKFWSEVQIQSPNSESWLSKPATHTNFRVISNSMLTRSISSCPAEEHTPLLLPKFCLYSPLHAHTSWQNIFSLFFVYSDHHQLQGLVQTPTIQQVHLLAGPLGSLWPEFSYCTIIPLGLFP